MYMPFELPPQEKLPDAEVFNIPAEQAPKGFLTQEELKQAAELDFLNEAPPEGKVYAQIIRENLALIKTILSTGDKAGFQNFVDKTVEKYTKDGITLDPSDVRIAIALYTISQLNDNKDVHTDDTSAINTDNLLHGMVTNEEYAKASELHFALIQSKKTVRFHSKADFSAADNSENN